MKGYDGALSIYPESDFLKLVSDMEKLPFHKKTARAHLRAQMSSVSELLIDRQGRALLPTSLLAKYHIGKEVVVIGALDHIEVWNKEEYEAYDKVINDSFEDNAELLGEEKD